MSVVALLRSGAWRPSSSPRVLRESLVARGFTSSSVIRQSKAAAAKEEASPPPKGIAYSALTVGVPKEDFPLEKRVAATPESVQRLIKPGFNVQIQSGAGLLSEFTDADYEAAGAQIVDNVWKTSDIVLKVRNT